MNAAVDSSVLAAVASPRRREILRLVWKGERAAGEIHAAMPDVTFGAVSLQLRALSAAGLVESRADGKRRLYRANRSNLAPVAAMLENMWADQLWKLKLLVELEQSRRGPAPRRKPRPKHST
jgi:DNA-binding transcriptional ArsR family regulator